VRACAKPGQWPAGSKWVRCDRCSRADRCCGTHCRMNPAASRTTYVHVWFSTKWRRPVLAGEIRDFILATFASIALDKGVTILEAEAIEDHVHLLVGVPPDQRLAVIMHDLKGATARAVYLKYPELRLDMGSNSFWQKSYGSRIVWPNQIATVRRYIRTQDQRPLRHE
jgi:putative transposase